VDFYTIKERITRNGVREIWPGFLNGTFQDIMIRGGGFYAVWDAGKGLWSTSPEDLIRLVDEDLIRYGSEGASSEGRTYIRTLRDEDSQSWAKYVAWSKRAVEHFRPLDERLVFSDEPSRREMYATRRLEYTLSEGGHEAFDRVLETLYDPDEREKLLWAIGSIVAGDSKRIQKFFVLHGAPGSGKSTVLNIISWLFDGYVGTFDSRALVSRNNQFALEAFKKNPLVAIDHDGDMQRLSDNTLLNSLVSHESMIVNEKNKALYEMAFHAMIFVGSNKPVKISDSKSGLIRRLIDVSPSGRHLERGEYERLMNGIRTELGAIAWYCREEYLRRGEYYYDGYRPVRMMYQTDPVYNFVSDMSFEIESEPQITLNRLYTMYKEYCKASTIPEVLPRYIMKEALKAYFGDYQERVQMDGHRARSVYSRFRSELFEQSVASAPARREPWLALRHQPSLLDERYKDRPAQYSSENGTPRQRWDDVHTTLSDIDTGKEHYVRPPESEIVIDFDLRSGESKSYSRNSEAADEWPATYAERSRSGAGLHLHYVYEGDGARLSRVYSPGIEIKVYSGRSALRRRLTECNDIPLAVLREGDLPLKEVPVLNTQTVQSEKSLRELIKRNLRKEIHPGTKPSIDFIRKILDDAYTDKLPYDLTDMRQAVMAFALRSTHHAEYCLKQVSQMQFRSEDDPEESYPPADPDGEIVFFDTEVFPNLLLINWKVRGRDEVYRMVNPEPSEVEELTRHKLVGFNNRRYDNHILYGRILGYTNEQLYLLSQKIIKNVLDAGFREAYNLSYADIYDFCSKKQSLKKWEIELGIHHKELGLPWDKPVPEERWSEVAEYCDNDVRATEAVFEARHDDWTARQLLADIAGMTPNATNRILASKIIFKGDRNPQASLVYTDLSLEFPGYRYEYGKSTYRGEEVGEGGYVFSTPGIHENVALLDVASMHPTSIECLNMFGPYTQQFSELKAARIAIKHGELDRAKTMLGGALAPYLDDETSTNALAYALKIVINSVYGLTAAPFDNAFRDPRNVDNICAKRGALFMIDLKHFVQEKGFTVAHIKTDSIKIPNATPEIISEVMEFGTRYGYTFEHEATYDRMCLFNDAVYIAHDGKGWHATGAQFLHPYVFKTLLSHDEIDFEDYCETKSVTTAIYLGDHDLDPDTYQFVGRVGRFVPVKEGGFDVLREKDGTYSFVSGTKGYKWRQAEDLHSDTSLVNDLYSRSLVDKAIDAIRELGDPEELLAP